MGTDRLVAGIETGGTKVHVAVGTGPDDLQLFERLETTNPQQTLGAVRDLLEPVREDLTGAGIASFGPLDLDPDSPGYGSTTQTPKPHWSNVPLRAILGEALRVPTAITTDVNGAAYGEYIWGTGQGADPLIYLTVGTGIGGGAVVKGEPFVGLLHAELGHMRVKRHPSDRAFPATASKGWPAVRRCRCGGTARPRSWPRITRPGRSRPSTWPRRS